MKAMPDLYLKHYFTHLYRKFILFQGAFKTLCVCVMLFFNILCHTDIPGGVVNGREQLYLSK